MHIASSKSQSCVKTFHSVKIVCEEIKVLNNSVYGSGSLLTCINDGKVPVISLFPDSTVTSVLHPNGSAVQNLNDIQSLQIKYGNVQFIPTGIASLLPNLKLLSISASGVVSLNKENLREFGESLEFLVIERNFLTSLEADLLQFQTKLKLLYLSFNPFEYIDSEFFENLKSLEPTIERVNFQSANCIRQYFSAAEGHNIAIFNWTYSCNNLIAPVNSALRLVNARTMHSVNNEMCIDTKLEYSTFQILDTLNSRIDLLEIFNEKLSDDNRILKDEMVTMQRMLKKANCAAEENSAKLEKIYNLIASMNLSSKD